MLSPEELHLRAALIQAIRSFFQSKTFLEVDTPIRYPVIIPEENIVPLRSESAFLQTSPELCMKRLLAGGNPRIYQICKCFRREERGRYHLEEFTMLEWYREGVDYTALMDDCEQLLQQVGGALSAVVAAEQSDRLRDLQPFVEAVGRPWQRITVMEAFQRHSPVSLEEALIQERFDEVLVEHVEPELGKQQPTILYDYPAVFGSLAKTKQGNASLVERFELYLRGVELANGFSELTDPVEQRVRFEQEIAMIKQQQGEKLPLPQSFLDDLDSIESAAGIALGVDRLFMLAFGVKSIDRAVSFSPSDIER